MRCFVAAWPDDATRTQLVAARALLPAPPHARTMQDRNLHLTLVFIGELTVDATNQLAHALANFQFSAPDWIIDRAGRFPRARVAWLAGRSAPQLDALTTALRDLLDRQAIAYDHRPFVPHVTLWRDVREFGGSGPLPKPIAWRISSVALFGAMRDSDGPLYRRIDGRTDAAATEVLRSR